MDEAMFHQQKMIRSNETLYEAESSNRAASPNMFNGSMKGMKDAQSINPMAINQGEFVLTP